MSINKNHVFDGYFWKKVTDKKLFTQKKKKKKMEIF